MSAVAFDIVVLLVFAIFGFYGWVTGFIPSLGAVCGAIIGIIIEYFTLQPVLDATENIQIRFVVGFIYGFVLVVLCAAGAEVVGLYIRNHAKIQETRGSRSAGAIVKVVLAAILTWVFFAPLAVQPDSSLGKTMHDSRVRSAITMLSPNAVQKIPEMLDDAARTASLQQMTDRSGGSAGAGIPDQSIVETSSLAKARRSVVKIVGQATGCHRDLEGTGFVYAPGLVATNAHVVAGARIIHVHTVEGIFTAQPVAFDALRDVAVLWVPAISSTKRLMLPALQPVRDNSVQAGQAMAIPGFPNNGPYRVTPARLQERFILQGPGIYGTTTVQRQAYALLANLMSGNSGGPLLDVQGHYAGMVFGVATDKKNVAYALSYREIEPVLQKGMRTRERVSTGRCVPLDAEVTTTMTPN